MAVAILPIIRVQIVCADCHSMCTSCVNSERMSDTVVMELATNIFKLPSLLAQAHRSRVHHFLEIEIALLAPASNPQRLMIAWQAVSSSNDENDEEGYTINFMYLRVITAIVLTRSDDASGSSHWRVSRQKVGVLFIWPWASSEYFDFRIIQGRRRGSTLIVQSMGSTVTIFPTKINTISLTSIDEASESNH